MEAVLVDADGTTGSVRRSSTSDCRGDNRVAEFSETIEGSVVRGGAGPPCHAFCLGVARGGCITGGVAGIGVKDTDGPAINEVGTRLAASDRDIIDAIQGAIIRGSAGSMGGVAKGIDSS